MTLIADDDLVRDPRPAAELRHALLAPTIIRMARLRGLGRFTRMNYPAQSSGLDGVS
jgi:hypothetical protein